LSRRIIDHFKLIRKINPRVTRILVSKHIPLSYPASNARLNYKIMFFFRVSNKKIIEGWEIADLDGLKKQLQGKKNQ
jgi:hypothetical protein